VARWIVAIADSAAIRCIRSSNSMSGRTGRIMDQTTSGMAEAYSVGTELTVAIRMGSINSESRDQWTWTFICASRSMSVWDFFVERDTLRPLCSPAPALLN
jgi:hypothetical protein